MTAGLGTEATRWTIHEERVVDDTRKTRLHIAAVELPDGVKFEQYVLRCPRAAMVIALDDQERVLLMWRHRFIIDRWCWELPGGYVDDEEDLEIAAGRELIEETGWQAGHLDKLVTYQPMTGIADHECVIYLAENVTQVTDVRDPNEAESLAWIPLNEALQMVRSGEIVSAGTVTALLSLQVRQLESRYRM